MRAGAWMRAAALATAAGALFAIELGRMPFVDYEGRYAEVARAMLRSGDWVTPRLDFTLFLNKPPLLYWLAAGGFALGAGEWVRIVSVLAAVVSVFATCRLGARLYDEKTGLLGGAALASSLGFALEARTLRPDGLVVATVVVAVLCWQASSGARAARARAWLAVGWAALGVGVLAKGLVPLAVAALPVGAATLRDHGWRGVRRLHLALGAVVLAAIVLPWHVLVSLRHPGFAWDYVVNQHLLFFLDQKFPRDSEGIPLAAFWGAFVARALPWVALLPFALGEGLRGLRRGAEGSTAGSGLVFAWLAGTLLLFSLAPSRLEHYSLPALPAAALLAARGWMRWRAGAVGRMGGGWLIGVGSLLVAGGIAGLLAGRAALLQTRLVAMAPDLPDLVAPAAIAVLVMGTGVLLAALRQRAALLGAALCLGGLALSAVVARAETMLTPMLSWKPVADLIAAAAPAHATVVFEAPEEYQLVGGLAFYLDRRVLLLEPPHFVLPTYLEGMRREVFLDRATFERRWRSGEPLVLVSDLQRRRATPDGLVPPPYRVLGRSGDRWVLASGAEDRHAGALPGEVLTRAMSLGAGATRRWNRLPTRG